MSKVRKLMATRCEHCPLCNYARANPEKLFSKVMELHGKVCPFWRSWQAEYGQREKPAQAEIPT